MLAGETSTAELSPTFRSFHDTHRVNFLKYVRSRGLSFHDAEDIVNDAFLTLYRRWSRFLASENREAFAFTFVKNALADHCRREDRQPTATGTVDDERARQGQQRDDVDGLITVLDLQSALDRLPERQAECMRLYALLDLSTQAIADYLDITPSTVTSNLHKARQHLADHPGSDQAERGTP